MQLKTNKLILIFLAYLIQLSLFAQEEKVKTENTEEIADTSGTTFADKYNYLIRAREVRTKLVKINLIPLFEGGIGVSYERKFKPALSWLVGGKIAAGDGGRFTLNGAARYYHNINRRIFKGKSVNNFSANYFALGTINEFPLNPDTDFYSGMFLHYGIQRRLWKHCYFDLSAGEEWDLSSVNIDFFFSVKVELGIAF